MSLDLPLIKKLSSLARLSLDAEEASAYSEDFSKILEMIEQINSIRTDGVEPLYHPLAISIPGREDRAEAPEPRGLLQETAPLTEDGYYLVPRFMD